MPDGRLEAIWIKPRRGAAMRPLDHARLVAGEGLAGNANRGGRRQVTLLAREAWDAAQRELGRRLDPSLRRANLLVRGIALTAPPGSILRVGGCRLLVHGVTRPCHRMDAAAAGLRAALEKDGRGGIYGAVLQGGEIAVGDRVEWERRADDAEARG